MKKVKLLICLLAILVLLIGCSSDGTDSDVVSAVTDPDADELVIDGKDASDEDADKSDDEKDNEDASDDEKEDKDKEDDADQQQSGLAVKVDFELCLTGDNQNHYAVLTGLDADGNVVWSHETDTYMVAQVDLVEEIGVCGGRYYYIENGIVKTRDLATGDFLWESEDTMGAGVHTAFGDEGELYLCGYFGPDFFVIDRRGETLCNIPTFDEDYWWAYKIDLTGDSAIVSMEGTPSGNVEYVKVNLKDYSYTIGE